MSEPVRPWHYLTQQHAPQEVAEARMTICNECPLLINLTKQCSKCMCIMPAKVKVAMATCPEGKW